MDTEEDMNLARLLDCYQVADADPELLERIVARAEAKKTMAMTVPVRFTWIKSAAALAATAVIGFWLGSTSLQPVALYANVQTATVQAKPSGNINLDKVILAPQSLNEVML